MNRADIQTFRAPMMFGGSACEVAPFEALTSRAPFPRGGGGGRDEAQVQVELESGSTAAAEARMAVGALEGRATRGVLDDARLLLSELVTNAVRHSGLGAGDTIGLEVSATSGLLRAEVTDGGRGFEPAPRTAPRLEAGGWGLHLVDRLADRWGVDRGATVRVWFEIDAR